MKINYTVQQKIEVDTLETPSTIVKNEIQIKNIITMIENDFDLMKIIIINFVVQCLNKTLIKLVGRGLIQHSVIDHTSKDYNLRHYLF
uniref:CSON012494 protein n=1 Tax=Culicoides sonorensis TaxID=179676 RepID=A0A336MB43_CULSO